MLSNEHLNRINPFLNDVYWKDCKLHDNELKTRQKNIKRAREELDKAQAAMAYYEAVPVPPMPRRKNPCPKVKEPEPHQLCRETDEEWKLCDAAFTGELFTNHATESVPLPQILDSITHQLDEDTDEPTFIDDGGMIIDVVSFRESDDENVDTNVNAEPEQPSTKKIRKEWFAKKPWRRTRSSK